MAVPINRFIVFLVCSFAFLALPTGVYAENPQQTEITMRQIAQGQFSAMYARAVSTISPRLEAGELIKPFAVVTDKGGEVKVVRIKQIEEMPDAVALEIMRRSLRALVEQGKIGASAILYVTDNPNQEADAESVLVSEMEHIYGPTLAQLIPFTVKAGSTKFGSPVVVEMKPTVFNVESSNETP